MKNRLDNINLKKLCDFFKILDLHKISDLTANHASIISSDNKSFYTNQHKYFFSEMKPSNLMKVNFLHDLYCAVKKIILNLFGGKKEIELSKDNILKEPKLYYRVHNFKWFIENINIKFKFELGSWRSVDVKFLKFFIHDFLFGRLILRIIFRLEEVFPKFFGRYGQYPILILKK